jgi:hypothetical protein
MQAALEMSKIIASRFAMLPFFRHPAMPTIGFEVASGISIMLLTILFAIVFLKRVPLPREGRLGTYILLTIETTFSTSFTTPKDILISTYPHILANDMRNCEKCNW